MPRKRRDAGNEEYSGELPKRYAKYSESVKKKLIRLVYDEGMKINSAAKQCKMNESTAKMSLKNFRDKYSKEFGIMPEKKERRRVRRAQNKPRESRTPTEQAST